MHADPLSISNYLLTISVWLRLTVTRVWNNSCLILVVVSLPYNIVSFEATAVAIWCRLIAYMLQYIRVSLCWWVQLVWNVHLCNRRLDSTGCKNQWCTYEVLMLNCGNYISICKWLSKFQVQIYEILAVLRIWLSVHVEGNRNVKFNQYHKQITCNWQLDPIQTAFRLTVILLFYYCLDALKTAHDCDTWFPSWNQWFERQQDQKLHKVIIIPVMT